MTRMKYIMRGNRQNAYMTLPPDDMEDGVNDINDNNNEKYDEGKE